MIDHDERHQRLDGPIHTWFGLTYSNYLVLHRSMMQSMPADWQTRAVALFDELDTAFAELPTSRTFIVTAATECDYSDLTDADMAELGITRSDPDDDGDTTSSVRFHDRDGTEHEPWERTLVPLPDGDPVPHYNRGRTFIEPAAPSPD